MTTEQKLSPNVERDHHQRDSRKTRLDPQQPTSIVRVDSADSLTATLEPPDFVHFRTLVGILILTTFLALCAAFDAEMKCLSAENLSWLNFDDDDSVEYDEETINEIMEECVETFRKVILPVAVANFILGLISILVIQGHLHRLNHDSLVPSHLVALFYLLLPLLGSGVASTYLIWAIMLRPKLQTEDYENPFKSLAAVDKMGHIGGNANLYYLSWATEILILVLLYQVCVDIFRWWHRGFGPQEITARRVILPTPSFREQWQMMLSSTSPSKLASFYRQRRKTWYQFLIRLRERSGYWTAALFSSILVFASSSFIFIEVLVNLADDVSGGAPYKYRDVCSIIDGNDQLPEQYCKRTVFAIAAGATGTVLSLMGIILHLIFRRENATDVSNHNCGELPEIEIAIHALPILEPVSSNLTLKIEFILSLIPSLLLGLNAVFATGVQGPAPEVGNLYYASFISFFFVLRICLGCLEEMNSIEMHSNVSDDSLGHDDARDSHGSTSVGNLGSSQASSPSTLFCDAFAMKERRSRVRKFFFLSILSAICSASAWDAAANQESQQLSWRQKYLVFAPATASFLSSIFFLMSLNYSTYSIASKLWCGGIASLLLFLIWLVDLLLSMHSDDSWAINEKGEIRMANLYYFSWGAIVMSATILLSYAQQSPMLRHEKKSSVVVIWGANVKVCMVILGSSLHVWHNIDCSADEEEGQASFCNRTKCAIGIGATGIICGWTVLISRIIGCPITTKVRSYAETYISVFLIIIFGVGIALITGIGGPGQSVGDLFYSSWLSFAISLGIFVTCVDVLQQQEMEQTDAGYVTFHDNNVRELT
mmetsp:Transcript_8218/g.14469  ORF Transcript_8218/g.14469 Transcript_8218/m.14469 type:complete len:826 (+) Transcript_8218:118-2595(+)